jgi:hypothetical protein
MLGIMQSVLNPHAAELSPVVLLIEWILQTNSTVTTTMTSVQTFPIDLSLTVSLLIAVSGWMVAAILAILRIHESRKEREQRAYRELVMTPEFQKILSTLDVMRQTMRAMSLAQRGQSGSFVILGEPVNFRNKKEFDKEMARIAPKALSFLIEAKESLGQSGLRDLVPPKIAAMFMEAMKAATNSLQSKGDFDAADKKFTETYAEIRKMIGIES